MDHLSDHWYELFVFIGAVLGAIGSIKKALDKSAKKKAALGGPIDQTITQLNARAASTIVVAPRAAPLVPPVTPPASAVPPRRAAPAGLGVVPIAQPLPSAEGLLVSGLFTQPRSLVAAFVASEILGPPVAFRHH
jgi:hypothetical protein